jgi:hypothetical protein
MVSAPAITETPARIESSEAEVGPIPRSGAPRQSNTIFRDAVSGENAKAGRQRDHGCIPGDDPSQTNRVRDKPATISATKSGATPA